ncbi:hypothetical protein GQ457_03G012080 [Hibiscus cannabinus]
MHQQQNSTTELESAQSENETLKELVAALEDSLQQHKELIDEFQDSMKMNNDSWDLKLQFARGDIKEVPEEYPSSLPCKPQETFPCFVFSAGGLHSNVQNPINLHGAFGSNLWASPIKTDVPNFNDLIELEKLKEEQSKDFGATDDKFKYLEERIKAMEGTDAFIGNDAIELSLVSDLLIPPNFKVPEFEKFDGTSCPNAHLTMFCRKMTGYENDDKLLIHCFQDSLTGSAMRWYNQLSRAQVSTWRELACAFKEQYKHVLDMVPDRLTLQNIGKKDKQPFHEYAQRWRDIAARVQTPLLEKEMTTFFINSLESMLMYYARLVGSTTRDFVDIVTADEAIERAIKSGKLNDFEASKKTHSKRRETEVNMVGSGRRSYTNYQSSPQIIYPTTYSKPVADPSGQRTQSQGEPKSLKTNKEKQTFTPIPIPYKDLFANLLEERLISPIFLTQLQPPYPAWYDPSVHCEYHAGIPGHSIENCMTFKGRVQHLINQNVIQLNTSQGPNVPNNPLPAHDEPRVNVVTNDGGIKIKTNISEVLSALKRKRIDTCSSETSRCNFCIRRIGTVVGVQVRFAFHIGTTVGVSVQFAFRTGAEEDIIVSKSIEPPYIDVDENAVEFTFRSLEFVNATFVVERNKIPKPRLSKNTMMGVRLTVGKGDRSGKGIKKSLQGMHTSLQPILKYDRSGVVYKPNPSKRMKKILKMREQRRTRLIGQSIEEEPMQFPQISETFVSGGHIHSEGGKKGNFGVVVRNDS